MNKVVKEYPFSPGKKLQIISGDLTRERVDAIVNAANAYLQHGGGVAGAISRYGGPQIQKESDQWIEHHGPVSHDSPAYTTGGNLHCRYVIHAVGPVWGDGDEDKKLADAISGSLRLGDQLGLTSLAFPAISTGIFGFPKERAARLILQAMKDYFAGTPGSNMEVVRMTLFDQDSLRISLKAAEVTFSQQEDR